MSEWGQFWWRAWVGRPGGVAGLDSSSRLEQANLTPAAPCWTKYTVTYAQVAAAALTNDIELLSLPAKGMIHSVVIRHSASFTGGLVGGYTLSVGIAGNLVKYAIAFNTFQAAGAGTLGINSIPGVESVSGATSIRVAATSLTGLLSAATQGSADIWVLTSTLP